MISFWLGLHKVSGNHVIPKNDTIVFIHNLEKDITDNLTFITGNEISKINTLSAKLDTTQNDYIFISIRILASGQEIKTTDYNSYIAGVVVNKKFDHLSRVHYIDPERYRTNI
jgi:acid phosphatase class B